MLPMVQDEKPQLLAGLWITSLGILSSRVLGMLREMVTAALLGMSGGGVMDAFVVAFRLPNTFRRLFGEGALAISYLPVLSATLEKDRLRASQLATAVLVLLGLLLAFVVLGAEALCWGLSMLSPSGSADRLVLGLTAMMLPYLWFICLAAQVTATLHALGEFSVPAMAPSLLNICWLLAAWIVAPWYSSDKATQAYVLAAAITLAGGLQLAVQLPALRRLGVRFDFQLPPVREHLRAILLGMGPVMIGLAATQLNTWIDSLLAWALTQHDAAQETVAWLGHQVRYPLEPGAASAIYYGERLYQFPQGMLGIAVATVIFPLLSRHAARGHLDRLGRDLSLGMRLVLFTSIPASAGLVLLAEPTARLLFEHGEFTAADTARTARTIAVYGTGVWAYCAMPVVTRGFYAVGDRHTPMYAGLWGMGLNLLMNLLLVWPLQEAGLALSTALTTGLQTLWLMWIFSRRESRIHWHTLGRTFWRTVVASALMTLAAGWVLTQLPSRPGWPSELARVAVPLFVAGVVFTLTSWALGLTELRWLVGRRIDEPEVLAADDYADD